MEPSLEPSWVNATEKEDTFECTNILDCTDTCMDDCEEDHACNYNGPVDKWQEGNKRSWVESWECPDCHAEYSEDCSMDDYL
jgi:hypothetical protein